jgi:lipoprotein-anchoring transpeptidase ErfK/SrfK
VPAALVLVVALAVAVWALRSPGKKPTHWVQPAVTLSAAPSAAPPRKLTVRKPSADLPVISYYKVPKGFPADQAPASTTPLTEGLAPDDKVAVYDAPGGRPLAYLPAAISGVDVTVPVVGREQEWTAVLLPSADRTIGWLAPQAGVSHVVMHDQLVLDRGAHRLTWLRDGVRKKSWTVATGAEETPTPLGRTFVLGRTRTEGDEYAGLDALVLGAVPEHKEALSPGLRDGHTAIHSWYHPSVFGHDVSNGCIRVPKAGQKELLAEIPSGTGVSIVA